MRRKRTKAERRAASRAKRLELRMDGAGHPWRPWDEAFAAQGESAPPADLFLAYCLAQGYVTPADGPAPGAFAGWEARMGRRYWRSTIGVAALLLAGAEPGTPVPPALRALEPAIDDAPLAQDEDDEEEAKRWASFVLAAQGLFGWSDETRVTVRRQVTEHPETRSNLFHWAIGFYQRLDRPDRVTLGVLFRSLEARRPNGLTCIAVDYDPDSPFVVAGRRGDAFVV